jgi:leucyl aminopeptidase
MVVGVYEGGKLPAAAQLLDKAAKHALGELIARGDMSGKSASTLLLHKLPGIAAERVLLVGLGKPSELNNKTSVEILRATFSALNGTPAKDAALYLIDEGFGKDAAWVIRQAVFAAAEQAFRADGLKSKPGKAATLKSITFATLEKPSAALKMHSTGRRDRTRHGSRQDTGQPARQRLYPNLPRLEGAGAWKGAQIHQDHRAGRKRHAETGHGFFPFRHTRQRATGQTYYFGIPRH